MKAAKGDGERRWEAGEFYVERGASRARESDRVFCRAIGDAGGGQSIYARSAALVLASCSHGKINGIEV
jgi:hypothetical protein